MNQRTRALLVLLAFGIISIGLFISLDIRSLMYAVPVLILLFIVIFTLSLRSSASTAHVIAMSRNPPSYENVASKVAEIEQELKRMGAWQDKPLPAAAYRFQRPFGMDTMAFEQWLQFVLIPRVHAIIESKGEFPPHSNLAVHAAREFDGRTDTDRLFYLLHEFDRLFSKDGF
jgi:uncharacterized protein YqcC (DUF446 family)